MPVSIQKSTLDFLKDLRKHNDREWFQANKGRYQDALGNFTALVGDLIDKIGAFDASVKKLSPEKCIFRIYRDTRFAKDKSPYKTHFGAHIIGDDKNCGKAGYYIHLEPGGSFLAGGVHMPEPDRLRGIREDISGRGKFFLKIVGEKEFKKNFGEVQGEKLSTRPKGFEKGDPMLSYLQFKDLIVRHEVDDKTLMKGDFTAQSTKIFRSMVPFNEFLNRSV